MACVVESEDIESLCRKRLQEMRLACCALPV